MVRRSNDYYWKKLDNVATFYASTTTNLEPHIYRLSFKLKEKINSKILIQALNNTLLTIPSFNVKLRRGFFWYYLEYNNESPIIKEDEYFPYEMINNFSNNYFLFKVTYFDKRINVDFSHILTDGTGALHFLETLITNYLKIKHPKKVSPNITTDLELLSPIEMSIDSFLTYSKIDDNDKKIIKERSKRSYTLKGNSKNLINIIIGTISVEQLKAITKKKNVTISIYLIAMLIYSIYHSHFKYNNINRPITIAVPVNLRNYFPSYSLNNFFTTIIISVDAVNNDYTFDELLDEVSSKMKRELDKDILLRNFKTFVNIQQNIILRFIPLFIKDILLRNISKIVSEKGSTTSFSNLGIVNVEDDIKNFIDKVDMIAYTDSYLPFKIGISSYGDNLSISFSSTMNDAEIERIFFTSLVNLGIKINISSNINISKAGDSDEIL